MSPLPHLHFEVEDMVIMEPDWDAVLPCEGTLHEAGGAGHVPTAPAAFLVYAPCAPEVKLLQCKPRVDTMLSCEVLWCADCHAHHAIEGYRFVPLGQDS